MTLSSDHRDALTILAATPDGCTETLLMEAHHFTRELLNDLVRDGLASAHMEHHAGPGGQPIMVVRLQITEAGRNALSKA